MAKALEPLRLSILSITNQKSGVSKTTTALTASGKRVLLVDNALKGI